MSNLGKLIAGALLAGTGFFGGYSCQSKKVKEKAVKINCYEEKIADYEENSVTNSVLQQMVQNYIELYDQVSRANSFFTNVKQDEIKFEKFVQQSKSYVAKSRFEVKSDSAKKDLESLEDFLDSYSNRRSEVFKSLNECYKCFMDVRHVGDKLSREDHVQSVRNTNNQYIAACDLVVGSSKKDIEFLTLFMSYISRYGKDDKKPEMIEELAQLIINRQRRIEKGEYYKKVFTENNEASWAELPVCIRLDYGQIGNSD